MRPPAETFAEGRQLPVVAVLIVPTGTQLFIAIFTGAVGTAYFLFGKRQGKLSAMLSGAGLCIYPYFVGTTLASCAIGAALMAAPFFFEN